MAMLVKKPERDEDLTYEPPLVIGFGINDKTVDNPKLTMGHTIVPPSGRNQACCGEIISPFTGLLSFFSSTTAASTACSTRA